MLRKLGERRCSPVCRTFRDVPLLDRPKSGSEPPIGTASGGLPVRGTQIGQAMPLRHSQTNPARPKQWHRCSGTVAVAGEKTRTSPHPRPLSPGRGEFLSPRERGVFIAEGEGSFQTVSQQTRLQFEVSQLFSRMKVGLKIRNPGHREQATPLPPSSALIRALCVLFRNADFAEQRRERS